jgi:hypothetical protein
LINPNGVLFTTTEQVNVGNIVASTVINHTGITEGQTLTTGGKGEIYLMGDITTNAKPWVAGANQRSLSGGGLGPRYQRAGWGMDAVVAWRDQGGKPTSDTSATDPLVWLSLSYKF